MERFAAQAATVSMLLWFRRSCQIALTDGASRASSGSIFADHTSSSPQIRATEWCQ